MRQAHLVYGMLVWLAGISALVGYLGYAEFTRSSTQAELVANTTTRFNTLASTLDVIQGTVDTLNDTVVNTTNTVSNLSTTTTATIDSMSITYDNQELNTFIESTGQLSYNGYLYSNSTADTNITDVFSSNTTDICDCVNNTFFEFNITNINSNTRVFISSTFSDLCQISYTFSENIETCTKIANSCKQTLFLRMPYVLTQGVPQTLLSISKLTRSVGSVCIV